VGDNLLFKVVQNVCRAALEPATVWMSRKPTRKFRGAYGKARNHPRALSGASEVDCLESQDSLPAAKLPGCFASLTNWCWPSCPGSCAKPSRGAGGKNKRKSEARGKTKRRK